MSAFTFNQALGREVELYNRVQTNDPANSALIMVVLAAAGLEADAVLKDAATLAAVVAGSTNEVTNTGYARKTLTDAVLAAFSVDETLDQILLTLPIQTFASISAGDAWSKVLICYDGDTTSGTDANIIPVTAHDIRYAGSVVVPNGTNIVVDFSGGFVVAK
jgi:hypothetical protein